MVDYAYPPTMHHDFELYSQEQEQQLHYLPTPQPFLASSAYSMDQSFSTPFEHMLPLVEAPRPQYHYDHMAQGHKLAQYGYHSPSESPHSTFNSFQDQPPILSASSESGASASSSALGSPSVTPQFEVESWNPMAMGLTSSFEYPALVAAEKTFVDPNIIQPFSYAPQSPFPEIRTTPSDYFPIVEQPQGSASPYLHTTHFHPYQRRGSVASLHSHKSNASRRSGSGSSYELDDETMQKGMCPLPECGRVFKDLKAHMLTHQNERPEKCPITTCEYHVKGFARKYDKNRHTLTHYKGTMVCGFCPGSGSAAEKSFNRADVFKRHLTSVHGVEQNPPNSRKKSPGGARKAYCPQIAGTCSTCSVTFANAQEFYEHLDDCVLRVVQQADPCEAINQRLLTSVAEDEDVTDTLDRNGLSKSIEYTVPSYNDNDEEEDFDEEFDNDDHDDATYGSRVGAWQHVGDGNSSKITKPVRGPRAGLTFSKGGVAATSCGRKKRKNYPLAWGCPTEKMKMKKRVLCVYDGARRLWKDDMMLDSEFEVRMKLPDGKSYVTDLDVQTMKRAEALHGATPEEKGHWVPDNMRGMGEYVF
ncbi:nucleic acid binding [Ascochyta rabiei]|uniref:Nucleic acid binding n=2 Tax=Didymella rabiei TaxID=5454 RepID=A0A162XXH1_DIDRA|nr:nucleic acid binding [Ascochyta rabiei]